MRKADPQVMPRGGSTPARTRLSLPSWAAPVCATQHRFLSCFTSPRPGGGAGNQLHSSASKFLSLSLFFPCFLLSLSMHSEQAGQRIPSAPAAPLATGNTDGSPCSPSPSAPTLGQQGLCAFRANLIHFILFFLKAHLPCMG